MPLQQQSKAWFACRNIVKNGGITDHEDCKETRHAQTGKQGVTGTLGRHQSYEHFELQAGLDSEAEYIQDDHSKYKVSRLVVPITC